MADYPAYLARLRSGDPEANPFLTFLEIALEETGEGYARFRMPVKAQYLQGAGFLQGGLLVAMADEAIAHAMMTLLTPGEGLATVELKSNFLGAVKEGHLIAEARVFKKGRTLLVGDALVRDADGRDVCRTTATFLLLRKKKV